MNIFRLLLSYVLERRPDLKPEQLRPTRALMARFVPDCLVTGYEGLVGALKLPNPDCGVGLISLPLFLCGRFRPIILA